MISKEQKVALTIGKLLSDFTLDLEAIGKYLATSNPHVIYARALQVFLTSIAVVVGTAFLGGTSIFSATLNRTFDNLFQDV